METNTGGFRGIRNTDTSAARQRSIEVRRANALSRKLHAAQVLLTEHGYTVQPPTTT